MAEEREPTNTQQQAEAEAEERHDQQPEPVQAGLTEAEALALLKQLRPLVMPMLEAFKERYTNRVRPGYPTIVDNVELGGVFGINLDPGFGAYFMTDGSSVYAEVHRIAQRTDTLSAANYEKFAGRPVQDRIDLNLSGAPGNDWALQARNVLSRLLNAWATQQTFLYRVDS